MFQPKFTITPDINSRIVEIERLRTILDQTAILPELEIHLRFRASVESTHSSTSIEGNPLNELQVQKALRGEVVAAPDYAVKEVLNYKRALDWLSDREVQGQSIASSEILQLHGIVMDKLLPKAKIGRWRLGNVYVVDEVNGKEVVRYTGPSAKRVPKLVTSFLQWISRQKRTSIHPILLAGLIHFIFVSIHPFSDGNGRSTRLLTHEFLRTWGYDFRGALSLDTYYLEHQLEYYKVLSVGVDFDSRMEADLTSFLEFFTKGFLAVVENVSRYARVGKASKSDQKPARLSTEELALLDYTHQFGSITIEDATDILSTSKRTAQRRLMELVEKEILIMKGEGPATRYVLQKSS